MLGEGDGGPSGWGSGDVGDACSDGQVNLRVGMAVDLIFLSWGLWLGEAAISCGMRSQFPGGPANALT